MIIVIFDIFLPLPWKYGLVCTIELKIMCAFLVLMDFFFFM